MIRGTQGCVAFCFLLVTANAHAARISDLVDSTVAEQAARFFREFTSPPILIPTIGCILLGLCCGLLGSFIVVRKQALVGDAISHAVLPGIAAGYLWSMNKNPVALFVGAVLAGLLGAATVSLIEQTTKLKKDTALGIVLASFFAIGACMIDVIGRLPTGSKSGLTHFMFGSAASLNRHDVILIAIVAALSIGILSLFYQQFVATSFDEGFSRSIGIPVQLFHYTLMLLLAFSVVVALQAVGVVLVSAMLIIPAAAAYLLCDRMHRMIGTAAVIGGLSAFLGHFVSFLNHKLPSGPFIVLASTCLFILAFLFSPRYGIVRRWLHFRGHGRRIKRENTLKAIYHILEREKFASEHVAVDALAKQRRCDSPQIDREIRALENKGLATRDGGITLTPSGWVRACEIVRNHRLWELYLTNAASIAPDHVHEDAEKIEHVLGERVVREIERQLDDATKDPHGRLIPSLEDMTRGAIGGLMDDAARTGNPGGFSPQN